MHSFLSCSHVYRARSSLSAATPLRLPLQMLSWTNNHVRDVIGFRVPRADLAALMRERHVALAGNPADFRIQDQTAMIRAQQQAGRALSRFAPGLAALVLGMGGVGLLAVSLLSVRERYAEIGLRMAVGGRPRDILAQFLIEAVLISALGGLAGLGVGAAGILFGTAVTRWPMVLSWEAVVFALSISMMLAVVFGAYPALRAARLDPILALNSK